jgi:hypothetical protein
LLREKIANGSFVLPRIAAKASGHKVLETVVAALHYWRDMVQSGSESGKLLGAIVALIGVLLVHLNSVFPNVVVVDFGGGDFRYWFRRSALSAEGPADTAFRPGLVHLLF